MEYRKFRSDELFTGETLLDDTRVLVTDEKGTILDIVGVDDAGPDVAYHPGILLPGLVNCHCHLELSHLKDVIPPHTGLIEFLCSVVTKRGFEPEVIQDAIISAEQEMYRNGIVAVGDIGNTADTAAVKARSRVYWQNFTEVLSLTDEKAEENFLHFQQVARSLESALAASDLPHRTSLVPHAPYTISPRSFRLINDATQGKVISMHNQEHPAEDELYRSGGGGYLRLFRIFGLDHSPFPVTGMSSIRSCLPYFDKGQTLLLVHNTYMPEEDIVWANEYAAAHSLQLVYCFCVNANLYIENRVPDIPLFMRHNCRIALGTDSYSSNWELNLVREMSVVANRFPGIPVTTIMQWATLSGAQALGIDNQYGSFQKGKRPGVVITNRNLEQVTRLL